MAGERVRGREEGSSMIVSVCVCVCVCVCVSAGASPEVQGHQ